MKAFFIVVIFIAAFLLFAKATIGNANLTSNVPGSDQTAAQAPAQAQPQVITIQESPTTTPNNSSVPVTGGCTNPYTVQDGDSLSQIAVNCNTTIAAIRQANPQITDANMIFPGQQLNIPTTEAQTTTIPVTGSDKSNSSFVPLQLPTPAATAELPVATQTAIVPVTGALPVIPTGAILQVKGIDFPPNSQVNTAIGPQTGGYTVVSSGTTDANGNISTQITVPAQQNSQTPWVVVITTTTTPPIQAMSRPFMVVASSQ